jgi:hypothetical protein
MTIRAGANGGRVSRLDQPAGLRALPERLEEPARHQLHVAPLGRIGAAR